MDTASAFAMGKANRNEPMMVFDWCRAARRIKEEKPNIAGAGLQSDWEYTGGNIWENGKPTPAEDTYTFLRSTWAIPELELDGIKEGNN